jgi:hypothetical protein
VIAPNRGFWRQLIEFELAVRGANSVRIVVTDLGDEWPGIRVENRGEKERKGQREKGARRRGKRGGGSEQGKIL